MNFLYAKTLPTTHTAVQKIIAKMSVPNTAIPLCDTENRQLGWLKSRAVGVRQRINGEINPSLKNAGMYKINAKISDRKSCLIPPFLPEQQKLISEKIAVNSRLIKKFSIKYPPTVVSSHGITVG